MTNNNRSFYLNESAQWLAENEAMIKEMAASKDIEKIFEPFEAALEEYVTDNAGIDPHMFDAEGDDDSADAAVDLVYAVMAKIIHTRWTDN